MRRPMMGPGMYGLASQSPGFALSTPVPPPNWPISPEGAGFPGPTLAFALKFLPARRLRAGKVHFPFSVSCVFSDPNLQSN